MKKHSSYDRIPEGAKMVNFYIHGADFEVMQRGMQIDGFRQFATWMKKVCLDRAKYLVKREEKA